MTAPPTTRPHSGGWVRKLAAECWQRPGLLLGALAATAAGTVAELAAPLLVKRAIDAANGGNAGPAGLIAMALIGLALVKFAFAYTRRMLAGKVALGVQHRLRVRLLAALQGLDGRGQDRLRTGQVVSRSISDLQQVQGLLAMVPLSAGSVLLFVLALVVMMTLSPLLGLVALAVMPLLAVVVIRVRPQLYAATWTAQQTAADLAQHVEETVTGVRVVKGFGQEARAVDVLEQHGLRLYAQRMRAARIDARLAPALMVIPQIAQVGVIALGGWLVLRGSVSVGTFLAFSAYLLLMSSAMRMMSSVVVAAQLARAAVDRVFEIIEDAPPAPARRPLASLPTGPLGIEFRSVTFGYDANAPVLQDFSLAVAPGETVAIIGPAGSGKSTLALLLPRIYYPDSGLISLSGTDIADLAAGQLREAVAVVFDDPFLFSDTIAANIALGRPDAPIADIRAAAHAAAADEFINDLPDGYNTVVGERGLTLSGGQRQRIALARAFLLNPRVLVLDDATSAVDAQTEAAIFAGLADQGRTTVILAHRESTLTHADRVVRLPATTHSGAASSAAAGPEEPPGIQSLPPATEVPGLDSARLRESDTGFRLRQLLAPVRWLLAAVMACLVVDAIATVAFPALMQRAIDAGALAQSSASLAVTATAAAVLVAADFIVLALATVLMARAGERVLFALRVRSYAHLQRLGLDYYEREMSGRIMTRMTTDVDALSTFIQTGLSTLVVSVLMLTGVSVALVLTDSGLGLIVAAVLPLLVLATLVFRRISGRAYTVSRDRIALVNSDFQENVTGLRISQAYRREEFAAQRFASRSASYQQARMRAQRAIATYFPMVTALSDIALAVVLFFGAREIAAGEISPGTLVAFVLYLGMLFGPIQQLTQVFDGYQQASVGLRRISELLRTPSSIESAAGADAITPIRLRGEVLLDNVGFRYAGADRDALKSVTLAIPAGATVALVGRTGAGKSTVMKLLARFYDPTGGAVLVDEVDLRRYQLTGYRSRLGVVPQEPHLFTGDIGSNIAFGRPSATSAEIIAAAAAVGAASMIERLPLGLRTPVGERGRGLSAGQRQLIALARAELVDPDLLLLDEATATLDPDSEQAVLEAGHAVTRQRTAVIVAHRLATAARADLIVVVDGGRIVEMGSHETLLAAGGEYAALWQAAAH